jgi:hypothetical protein
VGSCCLVEPREGIDRGNQLERAEAHCEHCEEMFRWRRAWRRPSYGPYSDSIESSTGTTNWEVKMSSINAPNKTITITSVMSRVSGSGYLTSRMGRFVGMSAGSAGRANVGTRRGATNDLNIQV